MNMYYFHLLVLKGVHHYWKYVFFFQAAKKQMEVVQKGCLLGWIRVPRLHSFIFPHLQAMMAQQEDGVEVEQPGEKCRIDQRS